jgi:hypothetical protein
VVSFVGGSAEKPFGGPLDAENVAAHRHGVQVEFEHLRLVVDAFQLAGNDHFLQLVDGRGEEPVVAARKQVLGELLADGAAPAGAFALQQQGFHHHPGEAPRVHALVLVEPHVFGCHQGFDHGRENFFVVHVRTVLEEVAAQQHAVGRVHFGSHVVLQGPQVGGRGHAAKRSEVDGQVERGRKQQPAHEYPPDEPEVAQFGPPPVVVAEAPELVAPVVPVSLSGGGNAVRGKPPRPGG